MKSDGVKVLRQAIRDVPDFPKKGIVFKDITPLLGNAALLKKLVRALAEPYRKKKIDVVVGIESRGFILGAAVATQLGAAFVPVRKKGKLPCATYQASYALEYGTDSLEIHCDAFPKGARVLVMDDVLATGGTAHAVKELVKKVGGKLIAFAFLMELGFLSGRRKLKGSAVSALICY